MSFLMCTPCVCMCVYIHCLLDDDVLSVVRIIEKNILFLNKYVVLSYINIYIWVLKHVHTHTYTHTHTHIHTHTHTHTHARHVHAHYKTSRRLRFITNMHTIWRIEHESMFHSTISILISTDSHAHYSTELLSPLVLLRFDTIYKEASINDNIHVHYIRRCIAIHAFSGNVYGNCRQGGNRSIRQSIPAGVVNFIHQTTDFSPNMQKMLKWWVPEPMEQSKHFLNHFPLTNARRLVIHSKMMHMSSEHIKDMIDGGPSTIFGQTHPSAFLRNILIYTKSGSSNLASNDNIVLGSSVRNKT